MRYSLFRNISTVPEFDSALFYSKAILKFCKLNDIYNVMFCLENGANIESRDVSDCTPLIYSVFYGSASVVQFLIKHTSVNVNNHDITGWTPLHFASYKGNLDILKMLVEHKDLDFGAETGTFRTALHSSAEGSQIEMMKYLISLNKIDVDKQDIKGKTAFSLLKPEDVKDLFINKL